MRLFRWSVMKSLAVLLMRFFPKFLLLLMIPVCLMMIECLCLCLVLIPVCLLKMRNIVVIFLKSLMISRLMFKMLLRSLTILLSLMLMMHRLTLRNSLFILCLLSLSIVADSFGSDFAPTVLCAAAWVAPVIAGIGAAGSAIGSLISQADANKANRQIAEENREWQSGENEKSRQWEEKMWNAQNLYNTPSAAKSRLKEAGFNPYLVESSNIGNGNASSVGSSSMSGAPSTPEMKPLPFGEAFNNLGQSVAHAYNEAKSVDSNSANQTAMANETHVKVAQQLDKMYPGRDVGQKYLQKNLRLTNGENTGNSLIQRQAKAELIRQEALAATARLSYSLEKKYKETQIQNLMAIQEQEWTKISAEIGKMASDAKVNDSEIEKYLAEKAKYLAEKAHLNADTATINAIREYLVSKAESEATVAANEAEESSAEFENRSTFRAWMRTSDSKKRRAETEAMEGNYNSRIPSIRRKLAAIQGKK